MKRFVAFITFSLLFLVSFSLQTNTVLASVNDNITGWAWSSNIGWISFNCTNDTPACANSNYGLKLNGDNTLTGYVWSSAIGWIQFGGLSGFPTGSGTQAVDANINGINVKGWARALSYGGGWDGWISLSGAGPSYGITFSGGTFSGYAWGSDVMGWIQFDAGTQNPGICSGACDVRLSATPDASLDIKTGGSEGTSIINNSSVADGTVPTFVWTLSNMSSGTCVVSKTSSGGTSFTTVSAISSSGNGSGSALTPALYTYAINCNSTPGVSKSVSFTVIEDDASFSLGGNETAKVQVLSSQSAETESKNILVSGNSTFNSNGNSVTLSIETPASSQASTSFSYSFDNGSSYASNPTGVITSPYVIGKGFKVRVTRLAGAEPLEEFAVQIKGVSSGPLSAYKTITVTPVNFDPTYKEF